jgi:hypothetical protein
MRCGDGGEPDPIAHAQEVTGTLHQSDADRHHPGVPFVQYRLDTVKTVVSDPGGGVRCYAVENGALPKSHADTTYHALRGLRDKSGLSPNADDGGIG